MEACVEVSEIWGLDEQPFEIDICVNYEDNLSDDFVQMLSE